MEIPLILPFIIILLNFPYRFGLLEVTYSCKYIVMINFQLKTKVMNQKALVLVQIFLICLK